MFACSVAICPFEAQEGPNCTTHCLKRSLASSGAKRPAASLDQPLNRAKARPLLVDYVLRQGIQSRHQERTGIRVNDGKLLPIRDVIRDLQPESGVTFCDDTIGALRAISGNEPCEKETQLELETESAVTMRSAA